ncbi:hypothetical protein OPV22_025433 [Ensete ventricosum]|uniref:Uncharacterized protein n=1 Tax=Ensete ventricosum TaxID=4639 RepID=A0AAV8P874_ENSVE|nr:hypothetical protein OPV22_025433 [Ensete ventricosum]
MVTGSPPMIGSGGDGFGGDDLEKGSGFLLREQQEAKGEGSREGAQYSPPMTAPPTVEGSLTATGGNIWAFGISDFFGGKEREWVFNRAGTPIRSGICLLPLLARKSEPSAAATGALQGGLEIHAEASDGDLC